MVDRRDGARFAFEPREPIRIARKDGREDFDRDVAIQARIAGPVDVSHAAAAKQ
jgi:hypothetical protein